ncbi:MAG: mitochondrial fusion and transport protein ugo1 [Thelocarpon impressellum]|nr:MAG: mitochondrial fusion and transport protein ugo1 [Thelocarpon impressellum]
MATPREGPNPLRPYYIPPSIELNTHAAATPNTTTSSPGLSRPAPTSNGFSSARDIFSDLDYSDYLSDASPSAAEITKRLLDQALWKYTSVLIAQPFEVAKTVLQCNLAVVSDEHAERSTKRGQVYEEDDLSSDDSDDVSRYFTPVVPPTEPMPSRRKRRSHARHAESSPPAAKKAKPPHKITLLRPSSLIDTISEIWAKEGSWGVWKAANTTFIYSVLLKTTESWTRSLLAAVFNVPDPGLLAGVGDVMDSPYPLASLGVAVAAAGIAGVVLAPLDMVRTQLILTPTTSRPRQMLPALRGLPSLACPPGLVPLTFFNSALSPLITTSTPLVLRSRFGIDPVLTPTAYSALTFASATADLFLRLPIETVLRRAQMHSITCSRSPQPTETIIDVGEYRGLVGTMWHIVREEGTREEAGQASPAGSTPREWDGRDKEVKRTRKGQGVEGLWRGWRVGMWGLVGMWGAAGLGAAGTGGEF